MKGTNFLDSCPLVFFDKFHRWLYLRLVKNLRKYMLDKRIKLKLKEYYKEL